MATQIEIQVCHTCKNDYNGIDFCDNKITIFPS